MGNESRETAYSNSPTWVQWPWRRKECCRSIRPLAEGLQLSALCRWIIHSWVKYSFRWNWENYNKLTGLYSTPTTWRNCVIVWKITFHKVYACRKSNTLPNFVIHNAGLKAIESIDEFFKATMSRFGSKQCSMKQCQQLAGLGRYPEQTTPHMGCARTGSWESESSPSRGPWLSSSSFPRPWRNRQSKSGRLLQPPTVGVKPLRFIE